MPHLFYLLSLLLVLFTSCQKRHADTDTRPVLTVSIAPLNYVVKAIADSNYLVVTMMPQGAAPETYEPTPRQMMELNRSEVLFRIGTLGFEQTHLQKMAESTPGMTLVNLAEGIRPIIGEACLHEHHEHQTTDSYDPHVWMSPASMKVLAANVCQTLTKLNPSEKNAFTKRYSRFEQRMDSLDGVLKAKLNSVSQRTFLIFHPALGYFARDYGLRQLSVEQDGKTPSAESMQQLIVKARAEGVGTVFVSEEHDGKAARRIAEAIGARIVTINPLSDDWEKQMNLIANALNNE